MMGFPVRIRSTVQPSRPAGGCGHEHLVGFYEAEEFLVDTVSGFVGPALHDGDAAIVVATATHRSAFDAALHASGVDVAAAVAADRYLAFDAAELLATFMVGGAPDAGRFRDTIGGVIERAGAAGRRVRIYGEMAALLWDAGDVASAIALEDLWNDLAAAHEFALLCAYPMRAFEDEASAAAFKRICEQHTTVIPSEGYSLLGGADEQQRAVARLQQEMAALRADVARLRAEQEILADQTASDRDQSQADAHRRTSNRDLAAADRDRAASDRDQTASDRDQSQAEADRRTSNRDLAAADRGRAAADRDQTASDRDQATADRERAAADREEAAADRAAATHDREQARAELRHAQLDHLTGAFGRELGMVVLEREINRARHGNGRLALAYVDVDWLKQVNDRQGHAAGDALLRDVVGAIQTHLRSYDPIVRVGGDEFVCALGDTTPDEARLRFQEIRATLEQAHPTASISVGFAALRPEDTLEQLTERGDKALYEAKRTR